MMREMKSIGWSYLGIGSAAGWTDYMHGSRWKGQMELSYYGTGPVMYGWDVHMCICGCA
jgi:hypothetical protein